MIGENNTYGFIANTIATNIKNESGVVWNDALVVPWKNILDLNTNRTILKVINTNKQEPIKVKVRKNEDDKLKIEVTYSANEIVKILDEEGNILSENSTILITAPKLKESGIYKYIVIDTIGNLKEVKIKVEDIFVYQIPDLDTLKLFRDTVNEGNTYAGKTVEVVADIDMNPGKHSIDASTGEVKFVNNPEDWKQIGATGIFFSGTFDGGYHTISGLYIHSGERTMMGFFSQVSDNAIIKDIIMEDLEIYIDLSINNSYINVGGIVGCGGTIENCGINKGSHITVNQTKASTKTSATLIGGIVSRCNNISGCYNKAKISGNATTSRYDNIYISGVAECLFGNGEIKNCYNTGNISGTGNGVLCGGILGDPNDSNTGQMINCYNIGTVPNVLNSGGLIASNGFSSTYKSIPIINSYCTNKYSQSYWNGSSKVLDQDRYITTAEELKTYANRVDGFSVLGDAFMPDQGINDGYPILIWEVPDWQFTEKNTCIAIGETIDIDVIDIGKNMLHKNQSSFSWTSSNNSIATVDNSGKVTGVAEGEVEIIATNGEITIPATKVKVIQTKSENTDTTTYIYTAKDLAKLRDGVNAGTYTGTKVELKEDIDLSAICGYKIGSWKPIGTSGTAYFTGTFEGNNHTISNIYIYSDSTYQGLFGYIYNAEVKNITTQGHISGASGVGGISGQAQKSTIYGCVNNVIIEMPITKVCYGTGGIVGRANDLTIVEKCVNNASVKGSHSTGGIIGNMWDNSKCINSYNKGDIYSNGDYTNNNWIAGGIGGYVHGGGNIIENCYNVGNIYGKSNERTFIAGMVGYLDNDMQVNNCYSTALLRDGNSKYSQWTAGLVAYNASIATISNSYYLSGRGATGGITENTLKGYATQLGDAYTNDTSPNINNGYPILKWQSHRNN